MRQIKSKARRKIRPSEQPSGISESSSAAVALVPPTPDPPATTLSTLRNSDSAPGVETLYACQSAATETPAASVLIPFQKDSDFLHSVSTPSTSGSSAFIFAPSPNQDGEDYSKPASNHRYTPSPGFASSCGCRRPEPGEEGDQPQIIVSNFDYSVENHFKVVDDIERITGSITAGAADEEEILLLSNSVTFLRQWRDFVYQPRVVKFPFLDDVAAKQNVGGEVYLTQFSAASLLKKEMPNGIANVEGFSRDLVMNVGGSVWGLDWCPKANRNSECSVSSEFVAIGAHPPNSSHHKIGSPLTGRGAIQIWCFLSVYLKEDLLSDRCKKPRRTTPASKPGDETKRPRGRPRKHPRTEKVDKAGGEIVHDENGLKMQQDSAQVGLPDSSKYTAPVVRGNKLKTWKSKQAVVNSTSLLRRCGQNESLQSLPPFSSFADDAMTVSSVENSITPNIALPRMMLCLAHNGRVAWDIKWRPFNACIPLSINILGYLAVLLGNGALEVWEVPHPRALKHVYLANREEGIDPRFIKLRPVFRCSVLKCGDRQSIPLTLEWSTVPPHDMILAGCHDGSVALWKFFITDAVEETMPLLCFSADSGPIRTLAWAPVQGDPESANIFVTAGHRGFKFWDIRDPFRPLWDHALQGTTHSLDWLPEPRCIFGCMDDGTVWLLNLEKACGDLPVAVKAHCGSTKLGLHSLDCSSFSLWSIQASRLTGAVAYCGEEGTTNWFQSTIRSVRDPSRNRMQHTVCGSLSAEESTLVIPIPSTPSAKFPSMKRSAPFPEKRAKAKAIPGKSASRACSSSGVGDEADKLEVFPPEIASLQRVRWSPNKHSERWLCCGGAAGLLRCQEVDFFH